MNRSKAKVVGPRPSALKIEGDWEASITRALSRKRPPEGWTVKPKRARKAGKKRTRAKKR